MEKVAGRVGLAIALLVALVGYLLLAYWLLTPYIEPYAAYWRGETSPIPNGWAALTPYYAWPVLVASTAAPWCSRSSASRCKRDASRCGGSAGTPTSATTTPCRKPDAGRKTPEQIRQQGEAMQQEARAAMEEVARREKEADEQDRKGRVQARAFGRYQHWSSIGKSRS